MRYLTSYHQLFEIGESSAKPYLIEDRESDTYNINYYFTTDSGLKYGVAFNQFPDWQILPEDVAKSKIIEDPEKFYDQAVGVGFYTYEDREQVYNHTIDDQVITNRGELFRIMATVKNVLEEVLTKRRWIKYLVFGGQKGTKGNKGKEQRENFYLTYLRKQRPEWQWGQLYCDSIGEWIFVVKVK